MSVKAAVWKTVQTAIVILLVAGLLLLAVAFVLHGIAQGVGEFSGKIWLGYLITGLFFLSVTWAWLRFQSRKSRQGPPQNLDRIRTLIDPREWTRQYPLPSAGIAMAAGFITAVAVPEHAAAAEEQGAQTESGESSLLGYLAAAGTEFLKIAITPLVKEGLETFLKETQKAEPQE